MVTVQLPYLHAMAKRGNLTEVRIHEPAACAWLWVS